MMLDVTHRHTTGVQRDDHVVEPGQPACAFRHHPQDKRAGTVCGHDYLMRTVAGVNGFGIGPIAKVVFLVAFNLGFRRAVRVLVA